MATKEKKEAGVFALTDLRKSLTESVPFGGPIEVNQYSKIKEWIGSGNYALNALIGGSLFKGIPNNRTVALVGESGVGKSYLLLNMCREAQEGGYHIMYFDSEGAIDVDTVIGFGLDPKKFDIQPVSELGQFKRAVTTLCDKLMTAKLAGLTLPKIMVCLDSLGMLASEKEVADALSGSDKADFTKAKTVRAIFRLITSKLTGLDVPFVYTNHTYQDISPYGGVRVSGGPGQVYSPSVILNLSKSKLKEHKDDKESTGIIVTARPLKNRLAKPGEVKIHIHFTRGMNAYIGLEEYIGWDNIGVQRGDVLTAKEFAKLKGDKAEKAREFDHGGEKLYFVPNPSGQKFAVRHLGAETVSPKELFTAKVFTKEVLAHIDEHFIGPRFKYNVDEVAPEIEDFLEDGEEGDEDVLAPIKGDNMNALSEDAAQD